MDGLLGGRAGASWVMVRVGGAGDGGVGKRGGCFVSRERIKNGPGWSSVGCRRLDCRPL